jgi:AraC-like DNA-binding protein
MLAVMQDTIIPDLSGKTVRRLVTARVPLKVPPGVTARPMEHGPLLEEDAKRVYPQGKSWDAVKMHAMRFPVLVCVTEGEADIQMGVTNTMLERAGKAGNGEQSGGYILSLTAPAYFLLPPDVPVAGGSVLPWSRPEPHVGQTSFLYLQILPVGALCQLMYMRNGVFHVEYSLMVEDAQLAACMGVLLDEVCGLQPEPRVVHAQLLSLMLRLHRRAATRMPLLTDGLYSRFPEGEPVSGETRIIQNPIVEKAHHYIQLHLHEPLTPAMIASHFRLTSAQLNRILTRSTGLSIMGFVTRLRMETAQLLLRTSSLSVEEISRLVGYRQQPHFSRTFHSHTGTSPLKFRQLQTHDGFGETD